MVNHHRRNYSRGLPSPAAGEVFLECNLAQATPGTKIFEGVKGLWFIDCNLARAVVPDDAKVEGCNTSQEPVEPEEPEAPPVREYSIEGPLLKDLVDGAEAGGMDVSEIRKRYDLKAAVAEAGRVGL